MSRPVRISYWVVGVAFIVIAWLQMTSAMLAVFFCYLAITKLHFFRNRWIAVGLFVIVLAVIGYFLVHFIGQSMRTFPVIAEKAIPSFIEWAEQNLKLELPFTDWASLKTLILETLRDQKHDLADLKNFANFAKTVSTKAIGIIIGAVVAGSIFMNSKLDLDEGRHVVTNNLYSLICRELSLRFSSLFLNLVASPLSGSPIPPLKQPPLNWLNMSARPHVTNHYLQNT